MEHDDVWLIDAVRDGNPLALWGDLRQGRAMFGFLQSIKRKWLRGRKQIFQFWDGQSWRYADPMVIVRGLQDHPTFNWERDPVLVSTGDLSALKVCADAVRDVFGVTPFDGSTGKGLTEGECLGLLSEFSAYLGAVKKNGNPSPTPSGPTEPESSATATEPTTSVTSDSSLTSTDKEPVSPSVSPKQSD